MGDRIVQLILEKIDNPEVVDVQELEESVREKEDDDDEFGTTGMQKNDTDVKK